MKRLIFALSIIALLMSCKGENSKTTARTDGTNITKGEAVKNDESKPCDKSDRCQNRR